MCHHKGVPRQLISLAAVLAMLLSISSTAAATEPDHSDGQALSAAEAGQRDQSEELLNPSDFESEAGSNTSSEDTEPDSQPAPEEDEEADEPVQSVPPVTADESVTQTTAETGGYQDPSGQVTGVSAPATYQEVYERMIAFQTIYPEGTAWTNFKPYGSSGPLGSAYVWQGGSVKGANSGVGCAAFAFILSDAAFGALPARTVDSGSFTFEDIRVGDILRVNSNSHFVIVLRKSAAGITVAEANYNSSVHWGRALSEAEAMAANFLVTRYPENFVSSDEEGADEVAHSGTEGSLSWTLTNAGVLTISGSGAMPNYSEGSLPGWSGHSISTIVIEKGVTSIGAYAFYQCGALAAYIPDGVTGIGAHAFHGAALLSVTIPGSVKTVGDSAFYNCQSITSVTIGNGVATIDDSAFHGCTTLAYIDFPASVTSVGAGAFSSCNSMTRVRFMPGTAAVALADGLFSSCYYLTEVILPQSLTRIGENMFSSCTLLYSLYIPASVTEIGGLAFSNSGLVNGVINYGGTEAAWNNMVKIPAYYGLTGSGTINYGVAFDDPFAKDPNDPGDLPGASETPGPDTPDGPDSPDVPDGPGDTDDPGTPNPPSRPSSSSSSSGTTTITVMTRNPDGSTTTTTTNTRTGTVTKTTKNPDGSQIVVETKKDGTVTTRTTDAEGGKTETVTQADGSSVVTETRTDGTTTVITADADGRTETEVRLSAEVISAARQSGEALPLPIAEVPVARDAAEAPAVTVHTGQDEVVKVAIPAASPTAGTVALLVSPDGSTEILKKSVVTDNSVVAPLPDGAVVKIVDNSRSFSDVPGGAWYEDAVTFAASRELFVGTSEDTFTPGGPMTFAMLTTVLARYDGENTSGGTVWYEKGIQWAIANAISDGGDPSSNVTREQLAVMLWRYSGSPAASASLSSFTDTGDISGYAQEAMRWAVEKGIISGFGDGRLAPEAQASRAEVAAMMMRYSLNA